MSPIIEAQNLSRFYGIVLGLNNVTFSVRPGITGVVGPNGAGKTTLFRLLLGQIRPSSGTIRVFGQTPWNNPAVQSLVAYCPESDQAPSNLRPLPWLTALGMISGLSASEARGRAEAALARVQLAPEHWRKRVTTYSKGMKQRVKLAQCLLHGPQLVILDEPMNGLDPMGREDIANVLRQMAADGTSVLISSHILHDLEALCADFLLLRWGRIRRSSTEPAADGAAHWPAATTFRCGSPQALARFLFERGLVQGCDILADENTLRVRWREPRQFYEHFDEVLLQSGVPIFEVRATATPLEQVMEPVSRP